MHDLVLLSEVRQTPEHLQGGQSWVAYVSRAAGLGCDEPPSHTVVPWQACDIYIPKSHTGTCSKHMDTVFQSEGPGLPQTHCHSA